MHLMQMNPTMRGWRWVTWWLGLAGFAWSAAVSWAELPPLRQAGQAVPWERWRGGIIVLDFFAPQCLPCAGITRQIHEGVALPYQKQGGNAQQVPVHVLTVNIDETDPDGAESFRKRSGVETLYEDAGGAWFEHFGGRSVPLVVVLDATAAPGPGRLIARWDGYPGAEILRATIDRIDGQGHPAAEGGTLSRGLWGTHTEGRLEWMGESLLSSDYRLYEAGLSWMENRGVWDWKLQLSWNGYDLAYRPAPADLVSRPRALWEDQYSYQGRWRWRWAENWQADVTGGWYVGFSDYRSVWLDEYYRQYFQVMPGYENADPSGWNLVPGLRWECVPGMLWLQGSVIAQHDSVSPGYEILPFQPMVRGSSELETWAGSVSLEAVLTPRLRGQVSGRWTDTTARDLRHEYQASGRWAVADHWVARGTVGLTAEPPRFHAYHGQLALERDWQNRWFLGLTGRHYADNGLVRDPAIVSSAAPALESWQLGLTMRYLGEHWGALLSAGPYWTRYDEVAPISRHFSTLYADRDWIALQGTLSLRF